MHRGRDFKRWICIVEKAASTIYRHRTNSRTNAWWSNQLTARRVNYGCANSEAKCRFCIGQYVGKNSKTYKCWIELNRWLDVFVWWVILIRFRLTQPHKCLERHFCFHWQLKLPAGLPLAIWCCLRWMLHHCADWSTFSTKVNYKSEVSFTHRIVFLLGFLWIFVRSDFWNCLVMKKKEMISLRLCLFNILKYCEKIWQFDVQFGILKVKLLFGKKLEQNNVKCKRNKYVFYKIYNY